MNPSVVLRCDQGSNTACRIDEAAQAGSSREAIEGCVAFGDGVAIRHHLALASTWFGNEGHPGKKSAMRSHRGKMAQRPVSVVSLFELSWRGGPIRRQGRS